VEEKTSEAGRPYLSVTLDDPSFPATVYARLIEGEDGTHDLIWSRSKDEQRAQLLANGRQSLENENFDPPPVVKLFTPDAGATWLLTEIDPDDHDHAFGLCDLGQGFPELGYVSLAELQSVRGRLGLPVERDLHFIATKAISAYAREARLAERIVA
jgi:hypothetical protein